MKRGFNSNVSALTNIVNHLRKGDEYIKDAIKIEDTQDRVDILSSNQNHIILKVLETARIYNKWKEKPLIRFIKEYLLDLSLLDENELESKIYYYLELYEELNTTWWSEKLDVDIIYNPYIYSKKEILFELLFSNTYLPDYENQDKFNEEMFLLIWRIEKRIIKFMLNNNPIIFSPINPKTLLNYMEDFNWYNLRWVKYLSEWIIRKIWYYFSIARSIDIKEKNDFYINAIIDSESENWITRDDFISYLREDLRLENIINNKEYVFKEDSLFKYTVYIWENFNIKNHIPNNIILYKYNMGVVFSR